MFIVECEGIIYGVGESADAAVNDARGFVDIDDARVVHFDDGAQHYPAGCIGIWPATPALVVAVRHDSFGIRWRWNRDAKAADLSE